MITGDGDVIPSNGSHYCIPFARETDGWFLTIATRYIAHVDDMVKTSIWWLEINEGDDESADYSMNNIVRLWELIERVGGGAR